MDSTCSCHEISRIIVGGGKPKPKSEADRDDVIPRT